MSHLYDFAPEPTGTAQPAPQERFPFSVFGAPLRIEIHSLGRTIVATGVEASRSGILAGVDESSALSTTDLNALLGAPVSCVISADRRLMDVDGMIQGVCGRHLLLAFTTQPIPRPRRDHERYACRIPVVFRPCRNNAASGAWREGSTVDLCMARVGLWIPGQSQFPPRVQIKLALPALASNEDSTRISEAEADIADVLTLTGEARHGRFTDEGATQVGIRFDWISPAARLRIGCFLEKLAMRSSQVGYAPG